MPTVQHLKSIVRYFLDTRPATLFRVLVLGTTLLCADANVIYTVCSYIYIYIYIYIFFFLLHINAQKRNPFCIYIINNLIIINNLF